MNRYFLITSKAAITALGFAGLLVMSACSERDVQKVVMAETLEYNLLALCGDEDPVCRDTVKAQLPPCFEQSDWQAAVDNPDDEAVISRIASEIFDCIKDPDGVPIIERVLSRPADEYPAD